MAKWLAIRTRPGVAPEAVVIEPRDCTDLPYGPDAPDLGFDRSLGATTLLLQLPDDDEPMRLWLVDVTEQVEVAIGSRTFQTEDAA